MAGGLFDEQLHLPIHVKRLLMGEIVAWVSGWVEMKQAKQLFKSLKENIILMPRSLTALYISS